MATPATDKAGSETLAARASYPAAATCLFVAFFLAVVWYASIRNGLLFLVGAGFGLTLVIGRIGFAGPWRNFMLHRETAGFIATLVMLALASIVLILALEYVPDTVPNSAPLGLSVLVGAFIFGIGMQLGGGCGSGTMVGAGSGSQHALFVLLFFLPGSLIGSIHLPWWLANAPSLGVVTLVDVLGVAPAIILQVVAFGLIGLGAVKLARRRGNTSDWRPSRRQLAGCVVVVVLAFATLYISGRMWSITFGNALWGAKLADLMGLDVAATEFWSYPFPAEALASSVLANVTSVMNLGLLAGVALYTFWAGAGHERRSFNPHHFAAAALAGLLMGYGARLAFGCNIGALFSGSASSSLHAWLWFAAAWVGGRVGVGLRPRFKMAL